VIPDIPVQRLVPKRESPFWGSCRLPPAADIPWKSIEPQDSSKFIISHPRQIICGINVSRSAKEKLLERHESAEAQRIKNAGKRNLDKKPLSAQNGHEFKDVGK
jgi:hypothetical protein